ncbi:hypothetical protein F8388_024190 [Cannabis sativa]|uniref:Uncharacterized protein n=1 Tax=Cannabis sativa TaxID=3483 RepID=A0A7J6FXQ5_CANSA|nr:hypothetical protein F8388_024190 [Cannabis sativa]KAF4383351.1 hypothetical protein G4B88_023925 [Cannabis sativa]
MLISFGQDVNQNGVGSRSRKHSRFHFEEAWCDEEECEMVVKDKCLDGLSCVTPTMLKEKNLSCGKGSHFTTIQPTLEKIEEVVQVLRSRVSDFMNVMLLEPFKEEDVPVLPPNLMVVNLRLAFGEWDVKLILGMVPASLDSEDRIIWHYNTNGEYSVQSGYQVAIKKKELEEWLDMTGVEQWWRQV